MKKKILISVGVVVLLRIMDIAFVNNDPLFFLSPRNFNGRGLLTMPAWPDFLIPLFVILFLQGENIKLEFDFRKILKPLLASIFLLLTPVLIGLILNNYIQKSLVTFEFNAAFALKYLLFVLSFVAVNVFADHVPFRKKTARAVVLFLGISAIAYTQDVFGSANGMYVLMALINSVGLSTLLFAIGLRKYYKKAPLETVIAVSVTGVFLIFFVFNALSISYFTIFLPFLAMVIVAIALYKTGKRRTKIVVASVPFILALFLNYGLPGMVSPEKAKELVERKTEGNFFVEQCGGITVKYKDKSLRNIALKFANVIDKANKASFDAWGVSPRVKELVISGIGPGGFHAEFPDRIVGKIISEKYLKNCQDSAFLNRPDLLPDFPDPVNAILHEFSHLFGVVPYHKWWPGAEEEGWATYSATRLSALLYKTDKKLWQPAYNFKNQAEKITRLNLSGRSVAWSHPNEFGGFTLWYHLGKNLGLKKLYNERWHNTRHDLNGSLYYLSNPEAAKKVVTVFGKDNFVKYGSYVGKTFENIYPKSIYIYLAKTTGIDTNRMARVYGFMRKRTVNASVPLPLR